MPGSKHLNVPHMGRAVEGPLFVEGRGALVLADVFLVGLAAPRALGEPTVLHGRLVFHDGFLRLLLFSAAVLDESCTPFVLGG